MDTKKDKIKNLLVIWSLFFVMVICMIIVMVRNIAASKNSDENFEEVGKPIHISREGVLPEKIYFDADYDISKLIFENYVNYLKAAYIVIGTYPDAQLVKISPNVERNDYKWAEEFYCPDGELYWRRYKDGVPEGRIAIDVSQYQANIDWQKVKNAGVEVAIVRAGFRGYKSGTNNKDEMFDVNVTGAREAGIEVGVYYFSEAVNREEGIEEAQYVLDMVKGYDITQPIIIDTELIYETDDARANNISVEDRTAAVVGFCETVEAAGYTPMIYASRDQFIFNMDIEAIGKYEFWLAAYDTPNFPYHTEAYQYSPYGLMDGIEGNVDLDVWLR